MTVEFPYMHVVGPPLICAETAQLTMIHLSWWGRHHWASLGFWGGALNRGHKEAGVGLLKVTKSLTDSESFANLVDLSRHRLANDCSEG